MSLHRDYSSPYWAASTPQGLAASFRQAPDSLHLLNNWRVTGLRYIHSRLTERPSDPQRPLQLRTATQRSAHPLSPAKLQNRSCRSCTNCSKRSSDAANLAASQQREANLQQQEASLQQDLSSTKDEVGDLEDDLDQQRSELLLVKAQVRRRYESDTPVIANLPAWSCNPIDLAAFLPKGCVGRGTFGNVIYSGLQDSVGDRLKLVLKVAEEFEDNRLATGSAGTRWRLKHGSCAAWALAHAYEDAGVPMEPELVWQITLQLIKGLVHMHSCDIQHLDLKPANILLKRALEVGGDPATMLARLHLWIADFGGSNTLGGSAEVSFVCKGTPCLRPPEQEQGKATPTTDMWSLACSIISLFCPGKLAEKWANREAGPQPPPGPFQPGQDLVDQLPAPLPAMLGPCLHLDPARRPTAAMLLDAWKYYGEHDGSS
ncbi:hypothetical protein WJX73_000910 [Symbiochloris irregularis]|uniref:mitogen-activated protein kinase kinase kinase n=1 Tax=Symbiochloris irregularis TaxID=706552 RepID=A0AAW1PUJ2_9CHLO